MTFGFSVWKAECQKDKKQVAIKVICREQTENCPNYNVKKEVLIHQSLNHPNIIRLIEARKDADNYYLAMEWAFGGELFEKIGTLLERIFRIRLVVEPDVGFPEEVAHMYFYQLLSILVLICACMCFVN